MASINGRVELLSMSHFSLLTDDGNTWSPPVYLNQSDLGLTETWDMKVESGGMNDIIIIATARGIYQSTNGGASFSLRTPSTYLVKSIAKTGKGYIGYDQVGKCFLRR